MKGIAITWASNTIVILFQVLHSLFYDFVSVVVLKELAKPFNEDDERCFRATHKVEEYTHWNLDLEPSSNDKAHQARQWLEIATVVSGNTV